MLTLRYHLRLKKSGGRRIFDIEVSLAPDRSQELLSAHVWGEIGSWICSHRFAARCLDGRCRRVKFYSISLVGITLLLMLSAGNLDHGSLTPPPAKSTSLQSILTSLSSKHWSHMTRREISDEFCTMAEVTARRMVRQQSH